MVKFFWSNCFLVKGFGQIRIAVKTELHKWANILLSLVSPKLKWRQNLSYLSKNQNMARRKITNTRECEKEIIGQNIIDKKRENKKMNLWTKRKKKKEIGE